MMASCRLFIAVMALAALAAPLRAEQTLPASVYLDRLQGMWLGEIIGQAAGAAYEGKYVGRGGNTVTLNWSTILDPAKPWRADDDTVLEYMNLGLVYDYGIPSGAQLQAAWQTHVPSGGLYCANKQGRFLMNYGFTPPDTGRLRNNVNWNFIDSQITTEALGAAAPGMRQRAADLAGACGSVTNSGYALHAAQFYAAMYAAAPLEANVETVVAKGLEVVPVSSRSHEVIQNVVDWYQADKADGTLNWRSTQEKIYDHYVDAAGSHNRYVIWVESTVNLAMTTMAILYGQGELDPTVEIAVNGGFDSDCNPATAAGLVGLMKGYSGLPAGVTSAASNTYQFALLQNMPPSTTLAQMAAYAQAAAEREIVRMGGTIEGSGATTIYHLPDDVVLPPVEKPDPAGPRGLVRDVRQAGGAVTTSASIALHIAGNDPCNLDQIIDGITDLSYNGHVPYSTYDGANAQPAGGDWYQLNFDRDVTFDSLIFYEGNVRYDINRDLRAWGQRGGYFLNLIVEIGRNGVFAPAGNLVLSEPLDPFAYYQEITMTFDAAVGNAIRIRGNAGGAEQFTTITELEAFGNIPTPVTCSPGADPLWNNAANWSGGAVPGPQNIAVFGAAASRQITIGQAESALGLDLPAAGWKIDGPGKALTVGAGGIASGGAGTNTVIPAVVLSANSIWTVGAGNTLRVAGGIDGPDFALVKAGPGTLALSGPGAYGGGTTVFAGTLLVENTAGSATGSGAVTVGAATLSGTGFINGPVTLTGDSTITSTGTLTINNTLTILGLANQLAGGTVLTAGDTNVLVTRALTVDTTDSALDITNNRLIVDYAPAEANPAQQIQNLVRSGYNKGSGYWDGNGLFSSHARDDEMTLTAVGILDNADPLVGGKATFGGVAVDASSVLVRYTYWGDMNFDGTVNFDDYDILDYYYWFPLPADQMGWWTGDLDYDGNVDFDDYDKIDYAYWFQGAPLAGDGLGAVPEPATMTLLAMGGLALLRRARHRAAWRVSQTARSGFPIGLTLTEDG